MNFIKKINRRSVFGFTMIDLLVAATVVIVMLSFGLARFRTGQYSNELDVSLKQIDHGISTVRNYSLAGREVTAGVIPDGGYGIQFDSSGLSGQTGYGQGQTGYGQASNEFTLFAVINSVTQILPNGRIDLGGVQLISYCGYTQEVVSALPCQGAGWVDIGNYLNIIYKPNGTVLVNYSDSGSYEFVGGIIEHKKTGRRAYFYVSLKSGIVSEGLL